MMKVGNELSLEDKRIRISGLQSYFHQGFN